MVEIDVLECILNLEKSKVSYIAVTFYVLDLLGNFKKFYNNCNSHQIQKAIVIFFIAGKGLFLSL